jgi:hypothetical protein
MQNVQFGTGGQSQIYSLFNHVVAVAAHANTAQNTIYFLGHIASLMIRTWL